MSKIQINSETINGHVILYICGEKIYFVSYKKFYCSFQQAQAANFKVTLCQQS